MKLKPQALEKLKQILYTDYGIADMSDEEADHLGVSLLKVWNIAMNVFNKSENNQLQETA